MLDSELIGGSFPAGQSNALQGSINAAVAAAGSTQAGATVITTCNSLVTSGTGGVSLPTWASTGDGYWVFNATGSTITVYPPVGSSGKINGGSANAAITVGANKGAFLRLMDNGTNWGTVYS
jgi:predicted flavoprotein YhiN